MPSKRIVGNPEIPIEGIAYDSRQVGKDFLFAAIKGVHLDGAHFIHDAVKHGAAAILAEKAADTNITQVVVPDAREAMAKLSSLFYEEPSQKMTLIGVTGTNGKTTITYLVESIFRAAGFHAGVVGTINYRYADKIFNAPHTTPEAPDLQRVFKEMVDNNVTCCVMEVSSHSLAQKRVDGSRFIGSVFTNLTQDHLDYHKTMDEYFESKSRLFTDFVAKEESGFSVINMDDPWGKKLLHCKFQIANCKFIGYSLKQDTEIQPAKTLFSEKGIEAILNTPSGSVKISSPLLGEYNLQNIMAAVGVGIGLGLDKQAIEQGITNLKRVPGRLERIISDDGFQAVVDYAHTGDALERALNTLRPLTKGRLITIFGCGGDRDRGKRPIMGEIATRLSNFTIITSDNPRSEDSMEIIKEIESGIKDCPRISDLKSEIRNLKSEIAKGYTVIPDRLEAIKTAVNMAAPQDIILVAGKGHEDYQIIGSKKFPFDDTKEIRKAMEQRDILKVAG
ncbi:MAG: UDP-N-acetylmuramoyl-L-alanyl-D-glutamate--2,6-diaminopimelate ligase [Deltaproteobacteria bacterium]|nr:UDP-N-acetylmuramoyl-L-alanyl-D-glutamate--2,6-diaminopimelate ligase [Deltaproteobacteria bacterium]